MDRATLNATAPILRDFLVYSETIKGKATKTIEQYYLDLTLFFKFLKLQRGLVSEGTDFSDIIVNDIDEDMMKISQDMTDVKKEGAQYIIVYIHWGKEYERYHSELQRKLAEMLVNCGVNFIIGGHPHVVEDYEFINNIPVFYSLGNFISSQPEDYRTESVGISLEFDGSYLMNINCIPFKTENDDKKYFTKVVS